MDSLGTLGQMGDGRHQQNARGEIEIRRDGGLL